MRSVKSVRVFLSVWALCCLPGLSTGQTNHPSHMLKGKAGLLARKGGLIRIPAQGPVILVLNGQARVPAGEVGAVARAIEAAMGLELRCETGKFAEPLSEAARRVAQPQVAAALIVCDAPGLPMLLVAPEARWALVNVAALAADKPDGARLAGRVGKELWRAFGFLMGAAHSGYEECLMQSVRDLSDLDQLKADRVSPDPFIKIRQHALKIGASPYAFISYREACEQGWAPAPTNALQKAVWDEVRQKQPPPPRPAQAPQVKQ